MTHRPILADEGREISEPNPWHEPEVLAAIMDDRAAIGKHPARNLDADDFDQPERSWLSIGLGVALFVAFAMFTTWLELRG